jgi:hypothetical protein
MATVSRFKEQNQKYIQGFAAGIRNASKYIAEAALKEAFHQAVTQTEQDSGNAAWHWTVVGFRKGEGSGRTEFSVKYGMAPIGDKGTAGANRTAVEATTLKEGFEIIHVMLFQQGRTAFTIFNGIPEGRYALNAGIDTEAMAEITAHAMEKAKIAAKKATKSSTFFGYGEEEYVASGGKLTQVY